MKIQALGLFVLFVPVETEPLQAFEDRGEGGVGIAFDVRVVDAEDHGSVIVAGVEPIEDEGAGAADVEESGGRRGEGGAGAGLGGGGRQIWGGGGTVPGGSVGAKGGARGGAFGVPALGGAG